MALLTESATIRLAGWLAGLVASKQLVASSLSTWLVCLKRLCVKRLAVGSSRRLWFGFGSGTLVGGSLLGVQVEKFALDATDAFALEQALAAVMSNWTSLAAAIGTQTFASSQRGCGLAAWQSHCKSETSDAVASRLGLARLEPWQNSSRDETRSKEMRQNKEEA